MLTFESSMTPVTRHLKVLVYGGAGTGKTWFAIHAPAPLIIDTESSTDAYRGQPNLPPFTVAKSARPSEIITFLEQFANGAPVPGGARPETLVVDSFSLLWTVAQEAGQKVAEQRAIKYKKPPEEARLAFGDWSLIKRPIQRLYTLLLNLPVHVIVTARQKDVYDDATSEPKKVGEAPDIERNAVYNFDLVLKLEVSQSGKRSGVVEKSRFAEFPPGTRIQEPSWETFAHLASTGEHLSQNIDIDDEAEQEAQQMEQPASWTRSASRVHKAEQWLGDLGLSDAEASDALGVEDWRQTTLSAEHFKAAIEGYVEQRAPLKASAGDVTNADPEPPEADSPPVGSAPKKCKNCGIEDAVETPFGDDYCETCAKHLADKEAAKK